MLVLIAYDGMDKLAAMRLDENLQVKDVFSFPNKAALSKTHNGKSLRHQLLEVFEFWCSDQIIVYATQAAHDNFTRSCKDILGRSFKNKTILLANITDSMPDAAPDIAPDWSRSTLLPLLQMRETLKQIGTSAEELVLQSEEYLAKPKPSSAAEMARAKYIYEETYDLLHMVGCPHLPAEGVFYAYSNIEKAVGLWHRPCQCCKKEYGEGLRKRNRKIIGKLPFAYLFAVGSHVLHLPTCTLLHNARKIGGIDDYETAMQRGYRPCKVCKPAVPIALKLLAQPEYLTPKQSNALKLHLQIQKDMGVQAKWQKLSTTQKKVLSDPRYAFISGGKQTVVHLRSCKKVYKLRNAKGYMRFFEALEDKCTPCPECSPTDAADIVEVVPQCEAGIQQDTAEVLEELCSSTGYTYSAANDIHTITTPAGKWFLHTAKLPYTLRHINLFAPDSRKQCHVQQVIFLTYRGAFCYIHEHDRWLMRTYERSATDNFDEELSQQN